MVPSSAAAAAATNPSEVLVQGVACTRGHFNRPDAAYCSVCGTAIDQQTAQPVQMPRPSLGTLVLSDGNSVPVDRDMVLGRDPLSHDDVVAGRAKAVAINDPELSVSRAHAEIRLDGWDVKVTDCGSSNGTEIVRPDSPDATRLEPGQATTIVPGTKLVLGKYTVTFSAGVQ
ncbi:MAG: hypothetical protein QOC92_390 [Acidimicrobiaceae bacterium]